MDGTDLIKYLSSMGLGAFFGLLIKHFLDSSRGKRELLFNARRVAYRDVMGRMSNFFLENDTRSLRSAELAAAVNSFFSEIELLSGKDIKTAVSKYKSLILEFHDELAKDFRIKERQDSNSEKLHAELGQLNRKIESLMRKELGVE